MHLLLPIIVGLARLVLAVSQCFKDESMNAQWAQIINADDTSTEFSVEGSCCQEMVCGLACAAETPPPAKGFGIAVMTAISLFVLSGIGFSFFLKGKPENFFVAGRSLPLWVIICTLASQAIDSNALLGASTLSYKFHYWDGVVLPLGLGLSLINNGIFFARHINHDYALTLPDVLAKRYGKVVEVMVSIFCCVSFLCLLAGNLVGMGAIISYVISISQEGAIFLAAASVFFYTAAGGLFAVAYSDVPQAVIGWTGATVVAFYMIANYSAPPPSIGFPDYIYPDEEICQMYEGVPCTQDATLCCYNASKWCPDGVGSATCVMDNGAYPIGDQRSFPNQMTDAHAMAPFPNSIVFNWATLIVLAFGNMGALDFQARCMAAKSAKIATIGCFIAGVLCIILGVPFAYLGSIARIYYGPDTTNASYETDSCHIALGLPTCALWMPDPDAIVKLFTHEIPTFLGGWGLIGIVSASMSTCDGAILAMGTVMSHNILRNIGEFLPFSSRIVTDKNLLFAARVSTLPMTIISGLIASFFRSNHAAGATGYLLIVAFDVVLATVIVPLFGCFYTKRPSPLAALCAVTTGLVTRLTLEFALPKDGFLVMPFPGDEFLNYGSAASTAFPTYFDKPQEEVWDPNNEQCEQPRYNDWTGVDSLASPIAAAIVFIFVQFLERNGPIYNFDPNGVMAPYLKETQIKAEIYDSQMKLEASLKELERSQRSSNITDTDVDASQRKVAKSRQKLMESQKKLEIFTSSRTMVGSSSQDKVGDINGKTSTVDKEDGVESADDKDFNEFMEMVSTPQNPE
ncbi:hypothetical protein ACHAW5_007212 [Stephanodiscus triporus]|uniref:Uncharacterized protein n=1 Tax=Stephanodiscus triporus TaxID=2934178 RepID=A0ABD3MIL6_9STRA